MLIPWLDDPATRVKIERLDTLVDFDLLEAGSNWDAQQIRDTRIAQPLLFISSLISGQALTEAAGKPDFVAGHSIGEWSACVLAGILSTTDAMRLVVARGEAMASACKTETTGLAAVLGGNRHEVLASVAEFGLAVANDNGPGQLVVGGGLQELQAYAASPPGGSRVRILEVAGAFHTDAMSSAVVAMRTLIAGITPRDADIPVISNRDGVAVTNGQQVLSQLVDQIAMPVRWDLVMNAVESLGVTSSFELCPAGTLSGILRRRLPTVSTIQINSPQEVENSSTTDLRTHRLTEVSQ